jgi:leucyl-tRNA synthetase
MHLIYARFIHMFLYDIGIVPVEEPFRKVIHQGIITAGGAKMGKSKGNAVNPDRFDPDELRMFLMFLGPYTEGGDWSEAGIAGIRRFLSRMQRWLGEAGLDGSSVDVARLERQINEHLDRWKVNKIVSSFMEFYNANHNTRLDQASADHLAAMLRCFAPGFVVMPPGQA